MSAKIFVFSAVGGGEGPCYAMAEDGTVLGEHWCSHENFAPGDLGVTPDRRPDRHVTYREHYPNGYEMEFIPAANLAAHEAFQAAFKKNHERDSAEEAP